MLLSTAVTRSLCAFIYLFLFWAMVSWEQGPSTCTIEGWEVAMAKNRAVVSLRTHETLFEFVLYCLWFSTDKKLLKPKLGDFILDFWLEDETSKTFHK